METTKKNQGPGSTQFGDKAKDAVHTAADTARDAASHAGQTASHLAGQASHLAGQAGQAVSSAASQAKDAVSSAASTVGKKAEDWTSTAGSKVESLADTVRDRGPHSGVLGRANEAVADSLETAGHYIHDKNLSGMMDDMSQLIKRNPIPALLVGLGVGYLLGRATRS